MKKPLLVLVFLLVASVACYSDSPLWVFGVTEMPPTPTFLPTPDQSLYPSRFDTSQITLAPQPTNPSQAFFFVTKLPEELASGVRNAAGSCDYGSSLEILYIGHQFDNYKGDAYLDNILLTTGETSETLFDFEANASDWALDEAREAGLAVAGQKGVDFNSQRAKPADGQEAPDATNPTTVLRIQGDYVGDNWETGVYTVFTDGVDWSDKDSLSVEVFIPEKAVNFRTILYVKVGATGAELATEPQALTAGAWNTVRVSLSSLGDVSDVREFGVRIGPKPARTYYLVVCTGVVGWANENRMAGPVRYVRGQNALSRNIGVRGEELPTDSERPVFAIHDGAEPPISPNFPASKNCYVGEVVDILDISAIQDFTAASGYQIWYQIDCPQSNTRGWVVEERLFGPLQLPAVNGLGIVMSDSEAISLTEKPGPASDTNPTISTCPPSEMIRTFGFTTIRNGEVIQPYYEIECLGSIGWTAQESLIEIPYPVGAYAMVVGNENRGTVESEDEDTDGDEVETTEPVVEDTNTTPETELLSQGAASKYLPVSLADAPEPAFEGNFAGTCRSGVVAELQAVSSWENLIFYLVTCGENTGWIESRFMPNRVNYRIGGSAWFMTPSKNSRGALEQGYSIRATPSRVGVVIGQCQLYSESRVDGVIFEPKALRRLGFRLFYQVTCINLDGEEISGWIDQDTLGKALSPRNPYHLLGG